MTKMTKMKDGKVVSYDVNCEKCLFFKSCDKIELGPCGSFTCRRIKTTYELITEESAAEGDFAESGWKDEEGTVIELDEYDIEDGITIAEKAAEFIQSEGFVEASSSQYHPSVWYTCYGEMDPYSGEYENISFHLYGFSEDEKKEIWDLICEN